MAEVTLDPAPAKVTTRARDRTPKQPRSRERAVRRFAGQAAGHHGPTVTSMSAAGRQVGAVDCHHVAACRRNARAPSSPCSAGKKLGPVSTPDHDRMPGRSP